MGFAASQARFLQLTARLSDNEYEAQQISQERVALLNQMALYADEYDAATNNQVMVANVFENNGENQAEVVLSYSVITNDMLNGGLGMNLITSSGKIVVPSQDEMLKQIENSNGELTTDDFYVFEDVVDTSILQKNIEEGNFYITAGKSETTGEWDKKTLGQLNSVRTTYDKEDDAAAKSTYDTRMNKAEATDAMLEMRLKQVETEHTALETEMDSVQKVVDDNVEGSFKTFC